MPAFRGPLQTAPAWPSSGGEDQRGPDVVWSTWGAPGRSPGEPATRPFDAGHEHRPSSQWPLQVQVSERLAGKIARRPRDDSLSWNITSSIRLARLILGIEVAANGSGRYFGAHLLDGARRGRITVPARPVVAPGAMSPSEIDLLAERQDRAQAGCQAIGQRARPADRSRPAARSVSTRAGDPARAPNHRAVTHFVLQIGMRTPSSISTSPSGR